MFENPKCFFFFFQQKKNEWIAKKQKKKLLSINIKKILFFETLITYSIARAGWITHSGTHTPPARQIPHCVATYWKIQKKLKNGIEFFFKKMSRGGGKESMRTKKKKRKPVSSSPFPPRYICASRPYTNKKNIKKNFQPGKTNNGFKNSKNIFFFFTEYEGGQRNATRCWLMSRQSSSGFVCWSRCWMLSESLL